MKGDLKVWWIPQVPMKSFSVNVDTPKEGKKILEILAKYDIFQFENNIKPDYCNAGGLSIENEFGEFEDWHNDDGETIDEIEFEEVN